MLGARSAEGANVAVVPLTLTAPATDVELAVSTKVNEVVLIVELVIASEKIADSDALSATPVAPTLGVVTVTVGGVMSPTVVIKVQM